MTLRLPDRGAMIAVDAQVGMRDHAALADECHRLRRQSRALRAMPPGLTDDGADLHAECRRLRQQARALRARSLILIGRGEQLAQVFTSQAAAVSTPHRPGSDQPPSNASVSHLT